MAESKKNNNLKGRRAAKAGLWHDECRKAYRQQVGSGFSIEDQNGRVKLKFRKAGHESGMTTLQIEWLPSNSTAIQNKVIAIHSRMGNFGETFNEAVEHTNNADHIALTGGATQITNVDLGKVIELFKETKALLRAETKKETFRRLDRLAALPETTHSGGQAMRLYAKTHWENNPRSTPGGVGRKRDFGDIEAFLTWAVGKGYLGNEWRPLDDDAQALLIGDNDEPSTLTPPVKSHQLANLLDQMLADGRNDLWLAVAIVGTCGLRPAELAAILSVEEDAEGVFITIGSTVKRNKQTIANKKPPRVVEPMEVSGRDDGARALRLLMGGLAKFPPSLEKRIKEVDKKGYKPVGDEFRQLLERYKPWAALVDANPGITPYSLRHGFAWRGVKEAEVPVPIRDLAAAMGHNVNTHNKHYGAWTTSQETRAALRRANRATASNSYESVEVS